MRILLALTLLSSLLPADEEADPKARAREISRQLGSQDDEERITGLRAAAECQEGSLLAPLAKLLKHRNPAVREAAVEALALRADPGDRKRAALALAARLGPLSEREEDRPELLKLVQALHDLAQEATIKPLLDIKSGTDREVMRARTLAAANVPSKEAVERLIQYGYRDRRGSDATRRVAIEALAYATQVKVSGGIDAWRAWWSENKDSFDPVAAAEKRADARKERQEKQDRRKERRNRRGRGGESGEDGAEDG